MGKIIDLTNMVFNKLTVKELAYMKKYKTCTRAFWLCECECGELITVQGIHLKSGNTTSCGCTKKSIGEQNVVKILLENGYTDIAEQKRFSDCKDKNTLPFDVIVNTKMRGKHQFYLIEFDGQQHFKAVDIWGGEEGLKNVQRRDKIKNDYCKKNRIKLIRIPYKFRDCMTIEMLTPHKNNPFLVN